MCVASLVERPSRREFREQAVATNKRAMRRKTATRPVTGTVRGFMNEKHPRTFFLDNAVERPYSVVPGTSGQWLSAEPPLSIREGGALDRHIFLATAAGNGTRIACPSCLLSG